MGDVWIPVHQRLPTEQDAHPCPGGGVPKVIWAKWRGPMILWISPYDFDKPADATHWCSLENFPKPGGRDD